MTTPTRSMTRCDRCGCYSPATLGHCRWCKPAAEPLVISDETIAEVERVSNEWPDGIHTCAELQVLEPGRRACSCGRCPKPPACDNGMADLAPHRECPGCGRQQYLALSGWWTHCLADADTGCPPAWRA